MVIISHQAQPYCVDSQMPQLLPAMVQLLDEELEVKNGILNVRSQTATPVRQGSRQHSKCLRKLRIFTHKVMSRDWCCHTSVAGAREDGTFPGLRRLNR